MIKVTESHEWIDVDQEIGIIGITEFALKEMGEIVYIELPQIDRYVRAQEEVVILESTKAATDITSPVSGKIIEVNEALLSDLTLINTDPEGKGWLYKIVLDNRDELKSLHTKERYLEGIHS